ncbi:DUF1178 family protein [Roseospira goensis]|uniref:DUF1178 family protein n=1 Tax=Roseospira goensis TaxID=391922 RepID=A0A7W6WKM9_9PROT|nr:DUF1178 family protein [Roseospira goensis]MBB4285793.1 hypothetical protein [Roseospira goensis]
MILYSLQCDNGHAFEAWFRDSAAYDEQADAGVVTCPLCGSREVAKAVMAPRLARHHGVRETAPPHGAGDPDSAQPAPENAPETAPETGPPAGERPGPTAGAVRGRPAPAGAGLSGASAVAGPSAAAAERVVAALEALRGEIERTCDDVGDRFAEEARRIHYGETEARGIYGQTTPGEAEALRDEGVDFATIPWRRRTDA